MEVLKSECDTCMHKKICSKKSAFNDIRNAIMGVKVGDIYVKNETWIKIPEIHCVHYLEETPVMRK